MARRYLGKPETSYQRRSRLYRSRLSPESVVEARARIEEMRDILASQHTHESHPIHGIVANRQAERALAQAQAHERRVALNKEQAEASARRIMLRDSETGRVVLGCIAIQSQWLEIADGSPELYYVGPDLDYLSDRIGDQTEV